MRSLGFEVVGPGDAGFPELEVGAEYTWDEMGEMFDFAPDYPSSQAEDRAVRRRKLRGPHEFTR